MGTRTKFLGRSTRPKTPTFFYHLTRRPCIYFRRRETRRFPSRFLRPLLFRRKFHVLQFPSHFQCASRSLRPCLSHPLRWSYIGFWWLFPIPKHIIALLYDLGLGFVKDGVVSHQDRYIVSSVSKSCLCSSFRRFMKDHNPRRM